MTRVMLTTRKREIFSKGIREVAFSALTTCKGVARALQLHFADCGVLSGICQSTPLMVWDSGALHG